ncbi:hypothetical protein BH10CYA1_BH10CYA1_41270 [soil metagenome]
MPGAAGSESDLQPGHFTFSTGWRYVQANRYFLNTAFFKQANNTQKPFRQWHTLDVTGTYQVNKRLNIAATLPIAMNEASFLAPGNGSQPEFRQNIYARSVGDLLLMSRTWLLDPEQHKKQNLLMGLGVKLPTGNFHEQAQYANFTGLPSTRSNKPVPLTIMPGDGGVDVLVELLGYRSVNFPIRRSQLFGYGNYLITPRNTTHVSSQVLTSGDPALIFNPAVLSTGANVNTTPDTYSIRGGYVFPIASKDSRYFRGIRLMAGYRFDGSPRRDLIGGSKGFRQPGYFMAFEPGMFYTYKRHLLTATCPISFVRNAQSDLAQLHGSPDPRTTAFSPASLNLRYTYTF